MHLDRCVCILYALHVITNEMAENMQGPTQPLAQPIASQPQSQPAEASQPMPQSQPQQMQGQPQVQSAQGGGNQPPMESAPESMMQREPSAFDGGSKPKRKRRLLIPCFCGIVVLLVLAFGGLTAVAYFTDADIPFFSDIADMIGEMVGDELQAEEVQQEVADTVMATMVPLVSSSQGLISDFASASISDGYLQSLVSEENQIDSVRFELDGSMHSTDSGNTGLGDMDFALIGSMNMKEEGNEMFQTTFDVNMSMEGMGLSMAGEARMVDDMTYAKLDSFPPLIPTMNGIKGKWFYFEEGDTSTLIGEGQTDEADQQEMTDNDLQNLNSFLTDETIVKNYELLNDEEIKGNTCNCARFTWNQQELVEVMERYAEIWGEDFDRAEAEESVKSIEKLTLDVCIGVDTEQIHKFTVDLDGVADMENSVNLELEVILWDYNADITVEEPADAVSFEDLMGVNTFQNPGSNTVGTDIFGSGY